MAEKSINLIELGEKSMFCLSFSRDSLTKLLHNIFSEILNQMPWTLRGFLVLGMSNFISFK